MAEGLQHGPEQTEARRSARRPAPGRDVHGRSRWAAAGARTIIISNDADGQRAARQAFGISRAGVVT